ncbi:hypothetical protein KXD93_10745 [Mucilaginibacter sp. BJC16-A38]|uniref:hypothetical protein n=1 Tax=Mucilaginibacter phenanthrenivorans TaxID=1234842 RepID=UPI0021580840|nr:hypothetical protein [Mucilaginibacter phenanthrenivorans]MCR8558125.1 hypothetical protein [Mucilaginibacter phenanthrenivorans]
MKHAYVIVVVPASILIPLGAGLIKSGYKHVVTQIIFSYLIFAAIIEIVSRLLGTHQVNNLPLLHFYTIIEFLFIVRFFQLALNNQLVSRYLGGLMIIFSVFCVFDFVFIQSIYQFNSYPRPIGALIIIGLCIYYFFKYGESDNQKPWVQEPLNWMVTGLLVYFGSSLFHFAFLNVLYEHASLKVNYIFGTIHATLVMVMYLLFTAGFLYAKNE